MADPQSPSRPLPQPGHQQRRTIYLLICKRRFVSIPRSSFRANAKDTQTAAAAGVHAHPDRPVRRREDDVRPRPSLAGLQSVSGPRAIDGGVRVEPVGRGLAVVLADDPDRAVRRLRDRLEELEAPNRLVRLTSESVDLVDALDEAVILRENAPFRPVECSQCLTAVVRAHQPQSVGRSVNPRDPSVLHTVFRAEDEPDVTVVPNGAIPGVKP